MAGRLTLIKSVTSAMPLYTMQHDRVPEGIMEEIEKAERRFIWGDTENSKGWHAVAWERICRPKEEGGVGIKDLKTMNDAFLVKLLWRIHKNPEELWSRVLWGKYGRGVEFGEKIIAKGSDSRLWKEMSKMWDKFQANLVAAGTHGENMEWKLTGNGIFSTASAYKWLQKPCILPDRMYWTAIWKLRVPERVRVFLWRMLHKRLATKAMTCKWDGGSDLCVICQNKREDLIHALRDCSYATAIWRKIIPVEERAEFFGDDYATWVKKNIKVSNKQSNKTWPEVFAICCWFIWRWRNQQTHQPECSMPRNPVRNIYQYLDTYQRRWEGETLQEWKEKCEMISWKPPNKSWCKLNTDGMCSIDGQAGCGGVIRGDEGEWIRGFSIRLGQKGSQSAEAKGLLEGLKLCWELGFRKVEVECDAEQVVEIITRRATVEGDRNTFRQIFSLLDRDWQVNINHIWREGNRCADHMATLSKEIGPTRVVWTSPPESISSILQEDQVGTGYPRWVHV